MILQQYLLFPFRDYACCTGRLFCSSLFGTTAEVFFRHNNYNANSDTHNTDLLRMVEVMMAMMFSDESSFISKSNPC